MERREDLRAGDADRQFVGDRLRDALNEGRLNLSEYDERLQQAYAAKTYGELDKLLTDLPTVTAAQAGQIATAKPSSRLTATSTGLSPSGEHAEQSDLVDPADPAGHPYGGRGWIAGVWGGWFTASLITTAIWSIGAVSSGNFGHFWPIWVIVPFGAVCLATTIRRLIGGDSAHLYHQRDRAQRRARRRQRYR